MRMALQQKRKFVKVIIHSKALAKLSKIHGGVTRVKVEMITPKGVLEIHNPQNIRISFLLLIWLIFSKLNDVCKSKRFKSLTNYFQYCDLLDKEWLSVIGLVLFWSPNSTKNITEELHLIHANFRDRRESMEGPFEIWVRDNLWVSEKPPYHLKKIQPTLLLSEPLYDKRI